MTKSDMDLSETQLTIKSRAQQDSEQRSILNSLDNQLKKSVPYFASVYSASKKSSSNRDNLDLPHTKGPAYLISPLVYYLSTILLYVANTAGAVFIEDVEVVIGFIGSVSCSALNFFLPGMYFIMTVRKDGSKLTASRMELFFAFLFVAYGLAMGLLCTTLRIVELVDGDNPEE